MGELTDRKRTEQSHTLRGNHVQYKFSYADGLGHKRVVLGHSVVSICDYGNNRPRESWSNKNLSIYERTQLTSGYA